MGCTPYFFNTHYGVLELANWYRQATVTHQMSLQKPEVVANFILSNHHL